MKQMCNKPTENSAVWFPVDAVEEFPDWGQWGAFLTQHILLHQAKHNSASHPEKSNGNERLFNLKKSSQDLLVDKKEKKWVQNRTSLAAFLPPFIKG